MRFRQVHLDFHTSEKVSGIGEKFSKEQFQSALKAGHVNSITVFSKCHHGWAYHPTTANEIHPHLKFDFLKSQIEAAHEIGVNTPVYLSAGFDEKAARQHPEWIARRKDNAMSWTDDFNEPGYHLLCMNTPYLDVLIAQAAEATENYDADGIFLDIVGEYLCYCPSCIKSRSDKGVDPYDEDCAKEHAREVFANYTSRINAAIHNIKPNMPIFHNSGHILRGRRELMLNNTHLELESLPTGGWGYDHFPMSVRYVQSVSGELGMDYLGMTGKFHESWGEFGGFKHPNALVYETALDIANGAKCGVGDQLHPTGLMDEATYKLIGTAYSMVEEKEKWCDNVRSVADIGILSQESVAIQNIKDDNLVSGDIGAARIMLEGNYLFDVLDTEADFNKYKVIVLPDNIVCNSKLKKKLEGFNGKILASGTSGLDENGKFVIDLGAEYMGKNEFNPTYSSPRFELDSLASSQYVVYTGSHNITAVGEVLGDSYNSYFNRTASAFCSHRHSPVNLDDKHAGITKGSGGIYIAWEVFADYTLKGSLASKETVIGCLDLLLGSEKTLETTLPSVGVATVMEQPAENRYVHHLLYAAPVKRGEGVEVIEDIVPIYNVKNTIRLPKKVKNIYLAPQMESLDYTQNGGAVEYTVPVVAGHQMIVFDIAQ